MMHRLVGTVISGLALGVSAAIAPTAAFAGPTDGDTGGMETDTGYGAWAVSLSGDYSASKVASVRRPPPVCWWQPIGAPDPDDAEGVYKWFSSMLNGLGPSSASGGPYYVATSGYPKAFEKAVEDDKTGEGVTWYELKYSSELSFDEVLAAGCTNSVSVLGSEVPVTIKAFAFRSPPEPEVDARVLAEYAYDVMELVPPSLDWNPKIGESGNAALVNLPTWMWVDDPDSVQDRGVTAAVGGVSVTVTAKPGGMTVSSLAGSVDCTTEQARRAYQTGRDEASACTLTFTKGSYGQANGFAVTATVPWTASWNSNVGLGGDFPGRSVTETTNVPVVSSQALVTQVD